MNAAISRLTRSTVTQPAGDGPLLDAFLSGDQGAFAVLVRRHAPLVFATCRRILRHHQDAEDAFQATFLVLARRAADVWPREAVGSWLFGVARRVALNARSRSDRRSRSQQPLDEVPAAEHSGGEFDVVEAVHRAVSKLPDVYRAAVVACDLEGLSRKEAAERLGWTEGTLSGRLARARQLLARRCRRMGLALPAGGLAATFAVSEPVSADALRATIDLATGATVAASGRVAALTEGVVRSMMLFKFKVPAVVLLAVCGLGFGAFAATGVGDGAGEQPQPPRPAPRGVPKPAEPPARPDLAPGKSVTDRDRFQGTWRIASYVRRKVEKITPPNPNEPWVIEVRGDTIRIPYFEGSGSTATSGSTSGPSEGTTGGTSSSSSSSGTSETGWMHREYTFTLDPAKKRPDAVGGIDLKAPDKPVSKGIYEFTAPVSTCTTCHGPNKAAGLPLIGNVKDFELLGLCAPGLAAIPSDGILGLRLGVSPDGTRPKKFGDDMIEFDLIRLTPKEERARLDAAQKELEARLKAARLVEDKAQEELVVREAHRTAVNELRRAEEGVRRARDEAAAANDKFEKAIDNLKLAQGKVALAEKTLADLKRPQLAPGAAPDGPVFTVHVRTLTAAEKVIRVKLTGRETVLDALMYAVDDVPLKSDGVSVWIVREKKVMPVDLPGIIKKGQSETNYQLLGGDQLFVQAKPGK